MTSRHRDALVRAIVGRPAGLPDPTATDLGDFWEEFDGAAPWHVRTGFALACAAIGSALPRLHGRRGGLADLDAPDAEVMVASAATGVLAPLVEAAKVVACFAYLSDPDVDAAVRGRS